MRMAKGMFAALAMVLAAAGCVSVQEVPMSTASVDAARGRELSVGVRDKPDFGAMTAGKMAGGALFGALGGAVAGSAMVSAGNEIVAQNAIEDPAEQIGAALSAGLNSKLGAKPVQFRTRLTTDDAAEVSRAPNGADLVLDVRTIGWGFVYFPTSWSKYRVMYSARARLLDARKGQVLAESGCALPLADNADAAPTYDELLANGASRLKGELQRGADYCAGQFAAKMFSLTLAAAPAVKATDAPPAASALQIARVEDRPATAAPEPRAGSLPAVGSRWSYSVRDRLFNSETHQFAVELASSEGAAISELFSAGDEQRRFSSKGDEIGFLVRRVGGQRVLELAPYLLAYTADPAPGSARAPATYPFAGFAREWNLKITAVTRERVTVPAGVFDAVRISINGETPGFRADRGVQRFVYTVWYASNVGRYVQSRHQTYDRRGESSADEWVELTKFQAPGAR